MDDLSVHLKALTKYAMILLVVCGITWLIMPHYKGYIFGFGLGLIVGIINAQYLYFKIVQMTTPDQSGAYRRKGVGFATRASIAALAIIFAIRNDHIEALATVIGLLAVMIMLLVVGYIIVRKQQQ